ncbi:hypothetical protein C8R46DRAFT_1351827 [Mycena filopes]|nr:hypothetical protein C8R46DRAFT_1351827 [Mycena filopes]
MDFSRSVSLLLPIIGDVFTFAFTVLFSGSLVVAWIAKAPFGVQAVIKIFGVIALLASPWWFPHLAGETWTLLKATLAGELYSSESILARLIHPKFTKLFNLTPLTVFGVPLPSPLWLMPAVDTLVHFVIATYFQIPLRALLALDTGLSLLLLPSLWGRSPTLWACSLVSLRLPERRIYSICRRYAPFFEQNLHRIILFNCQLLALGLVIEIIPFKHIGRTVFPSWSRPIALSGPASDLKFQPVSEKERYEKRYTLWSVVQDVLYGCDGDGRNHDRLLGWRAITSKSLPPHLLQALTLLVFLKLPLIWARLQLTKTSPLVRHAEPRHSPFFHLPSLDILPSVLAAFLSDLLYMPSFALPSDTFLELKTLAYLSGFRNQECMALNYLVKYSFSFLSFGPTFHLGSVFSLPSTGCAWSLHAPFYLPPIKMLPCEDNARGLSCLAAPGCTLSIRICFCPLACGS